MNAHGCALLEENFLLCELDRVSIKGAHEPLAMFELIGERKGASAAACAYVAADARALRAYRTAPLPRPQRYGGLYNIRPPIAPRQPGWWLRKPRRLCWKNGAAARSDACAAYRLIVREGTRATAPDLP